MKRITRLAAAAFLALSLSGAAAARYYLQTVGSQPAIQNIQYAYYPVRGKTLDQIQIEINQNGPTDPWGVRREALTHWKIWWEPLPAGDKNGFIDAAVHHRIIVTIPELENMSNLPEETRRNWEQYIQNVKHHESNHVRNVEKSIPAIRSEIAKAVAVRGALSKADINLIANTVLNRIRELDRLYDQNTNGGRLEGATLLQASTRSMKSRK